MVILTGYDNYFATGRTREGVLGLYEGKGQCADFVILSRESVYTTNFMPYGFTPRHGCDVYHDLVWEFSGREVLHSRGMVNWR